MSEAHRYLSVEERQSFVNAVRLFKPQNPSFMDMLKSEKKRRYMVSSQQKHDLGISQISC